MHLDEVRYLSSGMMKKLEKEEFFGGRAANLAVSRRHPTHFCAVPPLLFWLGLPWAPFGGPCFGLVGLGPRWALPALCGWGPVGPGLRLFLGLGGGLAGLRFSGCTTQAAGLIALI